MKIRIVKPDAREYDKERYLRAPAYLKEDTIEIDLHDFWKQHDIDDKEYFLEQFIKEKLKD